MKLYNFLDSVIGFFSPRLAASRMRYRAQIQNFSRNYDAATKGRRWRGGTGGSSADTETRKSLADLRERSRDLRRNNGYHSNAVRRIARNVVGLGIRPTIIASGSILETIEGYWKNWAEQTDCDFKEQLHFYGLQMLVMQAIAESGEVIVLRKRVKTNSGIGFQIQVLEPDYIDTTKDGVYNGVKYVQGIEYTKEGKRAAIWLYEEHPNDYGLNSYSSRRVPITDVLHIYDIERPGQNRGVPIGVPSFLRIKDIDDYMDSELMRKKVAACFSVFVTDTNVDPDLANKEQRDALSRVEPGMIEYLTPGQQVSFASPPPADGYKEFTSTSLSSVASGYGMSYESLTNDLSQVNFSSARMGWLEFQRNISHWQENVIIPMFCQKVWGWFVDNLYVSGIIPEKINVTWTVPRKEMIDPVKEVKGLLEEVRAGFTSWSDAVRQFGYDPKEILRQIAEDNKAFDENNITLTSDPRRDIIPPADVNADNLQ